MTEKLSKHIIDSYFIDEKIIIDEEIYNNGKGKYKEVFHVSEDDEDDYQEYFKWFSEKYSTVKDTFTPNSTFFNFNSVCELVYLRREREIWKQTGWIYNGLEYTHHPEVDEDLDRMKILTFEEWKKHKPI